MRSIAALLLIATSAAPAQDLRLSSRFLDVIVDPSTGALHVSVKAAQTAWEQKPVRPAIAWKTISIAEGKALYANDQYQAELSLDAAAPELEFKLNGQGPLANLLGFPLPFVTSTGTSLVVPMNEGILYPVDDATIPPRQLIAYGGHGISMPWFGVFDRSSGAGVMAIIETPDDARIDIARQPGAGLFIRPMWEASRQEFAYARKIRYIFLDKGGYVAQAKRYREYARQTGLFKTLAEKRKENPNVDLLIGAANIWSWDNDKVGIAREMKSLGVERVLWSGDGNRQQVEEIAKLGYLPGRYDIFQDVWPPDAPIGLKKEGWPEDLVWLPSGDWMKGWAHHRNNPDGTQAIFQGGVISSSRQLERARQRIPQELARAPLKAYFIDTTTASPWREDYNPAHPLTRSEDRKYKMQLLEYASRDLKLVTGTETGIDPSVPFVDYYEGMLSLGPYRLPDAGRDMIKYKEPTPDFLKFQVGHFYRIPLWELVYHECVVSQWYWGDYNNKVPEVWDRRDLFNILYGTPPMYMFDMATWRKDSKRFAESYKNIGPVARRLGYDEMLSHEYLSDDHAVQRTKWASGVEVTVDFNKMTFVVTP
ncbi:MAG: glycoside hydrolase [Bryobacteraceae bacterium]